MIVIDGSINNHHNNYFPYAQKCTQNYVLPFLQMLLYKLFLSPVRCVLKYMDPEWFMIHPLGLVDQLTSDW